MPKSTWLTCKYTPLSKQNQISDFRNPNNNVEEYKNMVSKSCPSNIYLEHEENKKL